MRSFRKWLKIIWLKVTLVFWAISAHAAQEPLKIGYSDWPGWVAWEIALEKAWFEEAGVSVDFEWFDYVASMDAFAAGQLDAVCMTNGDTLVTGATGRRAQMILINDFSNGNDMIVARPGIEDVSQLKGKTVGVEIGFVGHLLLLRALEQAGMAEEDINLINVPTNETPSVLASGDVDAIVAWQPNSSQALRLAPGAKAIYSSANEAGLIYDVLGVAPESLAARREEWGKVVDVWYRVVDFLENPDTRSEGLAIMASRVGIPAADYARFFAGTKILSKEEAASRFTHSESLLSLWGSSKVADAFNVKYSVYQPQQEIDGYIDGGFYQ
ncbi:MAG: ABC transporter substrate-binding protein [Pseudomonadota bacterium]